MGQVHTTSIFYLNSSDKDCIKAKSIPQALVGNKYSTIFIINQQHPSATSSSHTCPTSTDGHEESHVHEMEYKLRRIQEQKRMLAKEEERLVREKHKIEVGSSSKKS